ncbi:PadR family transcriptional regulator [Candidatus Methanosphaera massiliense]|uniref:PadR family transcriptional regulator n=1 Tax=Methanosphaera TaxID=2316 RepID=UPI0023800397|nr:PadR family transcriptional regulator [Candidatus Methanosphaera massiliense]MDD6285580.1 PadR family transcriptional regulator [Methanobacteriaceae archaeon]MDE4078159.1 PadR family transcriptional regulator [Candidatus Methanosphaera massiliense]
MDTENKEHESAQTDIINTKFLNSLLRGARNIFLLWLISQKKIHGYGIMNVINEAAVTVPGEKVIHSSTIYPLLHSLENDGLIKSSEELNGNHKVKMYEITDEGVLTLNSIKQFIKERPENAKIISFIDDMIFNDKIFTKTGGE